MPKTASKRAQARKVARVQRAHVEPAVVRDTSAARRDAQLRGGRGSRRRQQNFFQRFPVATGLVVLAIIAAFGLILHNRPVSKATTSTTKTAAASCDLKTHHCTEAPPMTIDVHKTYTATITTDKGDIVIALDAKDAPNAVNNFVFLADQHYYDGTYFWRVEVPGKPSPIDTSGQPSPLSLVQGGSVANNGQDTASQPGYSIKDDKNFGKYGPGTVAMANTGSANTGSSQFFIDIGDETQYFSPTYVDFGNVTQGMDVVKQITPDTVIKSVTIAVK